MKQLLVIILMLLSPSSQALIRKSATPMLHSVLDNTPPSPALNFANDAGLNAGPDFGHRHYRNFSTTAKQWRQRGIGFTIAGGVVLALGAARWSAANAESQRLHVSIGDDATLFLYLWSAVIAYLGVVLLSIGLPIWLTHLNK